jgi:hypothetical protein
MSISRSTVVVSARRTLIRYDRLTQTLYGMSADHCRSQVDGGTRLCRCALGTKSLVEPFEWAKK